jgi:methionyl-tRNA synthetase
MSERIFIGVAWPYANGPLHLGHIAGAYLPADIFARYHRLKGNHVLMVSGSDQHGTPITLRAEAENKTPQEVVSHYHQGFLDSWKKLGISFDLFTTTGTQNHVSVAQAIFIKAKCHCLTAPNASVFFPTAMWKEPALIAIAPEREGTNATIVVNP